MLGNFSLLSHPCDMISLFLIGEERFRSDPKQSQGAGTKLIKHYYNDNDTAAKCGVTPLFPGHFCLLLLELIISQFLLISIITAYTLLQW